MPDFKRCLPFALLLALLPGGPLLAQSLKGSRDVMERQNLAAIDYGYSFLQTSRQVQTFYEKGYLVQVSDSDTLEIHNVSYPFARAEVKLFLERLSTQYKNACGEKLFVTSLTRPLEKQPGNASDVSVHPTGMAVDLRIPGKGKCRSWLESTLLALEKADVLDVTRERNPPHLHVALFTKSYVKYLATLQNKRRDGHATAYDYTVRRGDSLYLIARRNDTTIDALRAANNLRSDLLQIGQVLQIPGNDESPAPSDSALTPRQVAAAPDPALIKAIIDSVTVRRGDSLYLIARRNDTTIEALRAANNLRGDLLQIGQILQLPGKEGNAGQLESAPQMVAVTEHSHRVKRGDTLWDIALRYGVSINRIRDVNGLSGDFLQIGQELKILGN